MYNFSTTAMKFSFGVACVILIVIIASAILNLVLSFDTSDSSKSAFKEYFSSIKNTKAARMFNVVLVARRLIMVILMVCLSSINKVFLVLLVGFYQIAHTILIIWVRPYVSIKDNVNEVMIDIVFSILLMTLLYFNTKDVWNGLVTEVYFYLLFSPSVFIFLTSLGKC